MARVGGHAERRISLRILCIRACLALEQATDARGLAVLRRHNQVPLAARRVGAVWIDGTGAHQTANYLGVAIDAGKHRSSRRGVGVSLCSTCAPVGIVLVLGENGEEIFVNNHPLSQSQGSPRYRPGLNVCDVADSI